MAWLHSRRHSCVFGDQIHDANEARVALSETPDAEESGGSVVPGSLNCLD